MKYIIIKNAPDIDYYLPEREKEILKRAGKFMKTMDTKYAEMVKKRKKNKKEKE